MQAPVFLWGLSAVFPKAWELFPNGWELSGEALQIYNPLTALGVHPLKKPSTFFWL